MTKLYQTAEQRQQIREWLQSGSQKELSIKYAFSHSSINRLCRNVDKEFSHIMKARVWNAIREWKRSKSGQTEPEQIDLPGMPPTRRSILLEMIQKELDEAGDDKLERFYKAIITA